MLTAWMTVSTHLDQSCQVSHRPLVAISFHPPQSDVIITPGCCQSALAVGLEVRRVDWSILVVPGDEEWRCLHGCFDLTEFLWRAWSESLCVYFLFGVCVCQPTVLSNDTVGCSFLRRRIELSPSHADSGQDCDRKM